MPLSQGGAPRAGLDQREEALLVEREPLVQLLRHGPVQELPKQGGLPTLRRQLQPVFTVPRSLLVL